MDNQSSSSAAIACELEGVLLISKNSFPYFILTAFEAGSPLRALILFMFFPVLWLLDFFGFQELSLRLMIFVSTAGVKVAVLKAVAKATLSRFFLEDINGSCFKILSGYKGKKYVVTCFPKFMVEAFLREFLDVDYVIGTEVISFKEWCLGFVASPGMIINGHHEKLKFLQQAIGDGVQIDLGLVHVLSDHPLILLCKVINSFFFFSSKLDIYI